MTIISVNLFSNLISIHKFLFLSFSRDGSLIERISQSVQGIKRSIKEYEDMKIFFIRKMYAGEDRTNYPGHRVIESLYVTHHSDFKNMYFNIMIAL